MSRPTFYSVFTGVGGFDLALERAGWTCVGQCEVDPFATRVLERHWPHVRRDTDVRDVTFPPPAGEQLAERDGVLRGIGASDPEMGRGGLPDAGREPGGRREAGRGGLGPGAIDLLCGGFPCQDLSVAGRRAGLAAPRSGLFFEFVRLATELRPRWVLLENVPGLLSSNGGGDFRLVLAALGDAGYGVAWRVLDARWFGVPQRRRRVFLVGRLGAPCPPEVLFEPEGLPGHPAAGREAGADVAGSLAGVSPGGGWRVGADEAAAGHVVPGGEPAYARTARGRTGGDPSTDTYVAHTLRVDPGAGNAHNETFVQAFAWRQGDDSPHTGTGRGRSWVARAGDYAAGLSASRHDAVAFNHIQDPVSSPSVHPFPAAPGGGPSVGATLGEDGMAVAAPLTGGGHPNSHMPGRHKEDDTNLVPAALYYSHDYNQDRVYDPAGVAPAHCAGDSTRARQFLTGATVRRLTPTECARLQGFPDDWNCLCGVQPYTTASCRCPDGPRYATYGNAVCVPVVEWIGRRLLAVHEGRDPDAISAQEAAG